MQTSCSQRHWIKLMKSPPQGSAAQLRPLGLVISCRVRAAFPSHRSCADRNTFGRTFSGTERHGQAGMGALSLSLWELLCYFWGDSGLNISEHPTHTPIFPYKPASPNTTCIGPACSITPMQHSAKQSTLLKGLWNKIKEWIPSFTKHNIILSKENSDTESHLNLWFSQWGFWKHRWVAGAAGDVVEDFQWLLVKQKLLRVNLNVSFLKLFVRMDTF